jgi:hypothetical protein
MYAYGIWIGDPVAEQRQAGPEEFHRIKQRRCHERDAEQFRPAAGECIAPELRPLFQPGGQGLRRLQFQQVLPQLFRLDVPYTNNACERALRPSVIVRKVTGCFRSQWGAEVYAAATSVIATGRLHGLTALQAMTNALVGKPIMPVAA